MTTFEDRMAARDPGHRAVARKPVADEEGPG
jgi:hypothetical protein